MTSGNQAWADAHTEHTEVVREFLETIGQFSDERWHQVPRPNKWSAATLANHVAVTYAYGRDAATTGTGMRLLVPRPVAWAARTFMLPRILNSRKFPRGAEAPVEVRPDLSRGSVLSQADAKQQLSERAAEALAALDRAARERPSLRLTHAYFGPLSLLQTLRMVNAHTRHHTGGMRWRLHA